MSDLPHQQQHHFFWSHSQPTAPDHRPHTVHASSPSRISEELDHDSSTQVTPPSLLADRTRSHDRPRPFSRDVTGLDFMTFSHPPPPPTQPSATGSAAATATPDAISPAWSSADTVPFAHASGRRRPSRRTFGLSSTSFPPVTTSNDKRADQLKTASLGRRFSRKYGERLSEIKEMAKSASLASRARRSSNPHGNDHDAPGHVEPYINPSVLHPLPSKRGSPQNDTRSKKIRPIFGHSHSDRKDTPAPPPAFGGLTARPASRPPPPPPPPASSALGQLPGGAGARKAAAAYNTSGPSFNPHPFDPSDDLHARRRRIGSLSSAADSGADLSMDGDSVCHDKDGDVDMDSSAPAVRTTRDFVVFLPHEISLQIFEYLDAGHLIKAQMVNSAWAGLTNETSVWRSAFLRRFGRQIYTDPAPIQVGGVGVGRANRPVQEYKKMYRARVEIEQNWRKGPQDAGKAVYLSGHTDSVYCLQFDEEKIITGSRDRTIRVWDINTFQCIRVIGGPSVRPQLGPKNQRTVDYPAFHMATASVNGTAYGDSIYHIPSEWHDASILCLQYDDKILVTGSSDSDLLIWDIHTYEPIKRLRKHTGGVLDVALDANYIVSCSKDSRIIVWDRKTFEPRGDLTGHRGPVNAVQLRGKFLVSASGDGIARLWDLDQMKLVQEFSAKERGLAAVEFSEDMKYVLAGGNDHITYKFETESGREVKQFTGHSQLVRSLWLDSANNRVVSGSYDLDLRVYDFVTGDEIWRAEEWTTSWMLAAKSDYRRIVSTSQDGRILIVDFGLHKGGRRDGEKVDNLELLRGTEHTTAITFRDPWATSAARSG